MKASTLNPLTLPSVALNLKARVFVPVVMDVAGIVIWIVWKPPPIPPKALACPNRVTGPCAIGCQPPLLSCTLAWVSVRSPWICIQRFNPLRFVPAGMLNETVAVVPFAPITSTGKVIVVGGAVWLAAGFNVTLAEAAFVESVALVAVTVTVVCVVTLLGAA